MTKIVILILTAFVAFATTLCCTAYPMSDKSVGDISKRISEAPRYHIRIKINFKETILAVCFGALVHQNYIVAPTTDCLQTHEENRNTQIFIYPHSIYLDNTFEIGVPATSAIKSEKYNIGVIYVENANLGVAIRLRVYNHHLHDNKNVNIYGFNTIFNNEKQNDCFMNKDKMKTIEKDKVQNCFKGQELQDYSFTISTKKPISTSAMDNGSPIVFKNFKGKERLVALVIGYKEQCQDVNGKTVSLGIELSHQDIANEILQLSDNNIDIRKSKKI